MPFQPGDTGNPHGRPKIKPFTEALRILALRDNADKKIELPKGARNIDVIARELLLSAINGDRMSITEVRNTLEGTPAQTQIISGDPDNPLETHHQLTDEDCIRIAASKLKPTGETK